MAEVVSLDFVLNCVEGPLVVKIDVEGTGRIEGTLRCERFRPYIIFEVYRFDEFDKVKGVTLLSGYVFMLLKWELENFIARVRARRGARVVWRLCVSKLFSPEFSQCL